MEKDHISLREFARRMGVGEKTIRDGIKAQKISQGVIYDKGKPKIVFPIAKKEFEDYRLGGQTRDRELYHQIKNKGEDLRMSDIDSVNCNLDNDTSLAEATRIEKIHKARKAFLEVEELSGSLVSKETVYKELYKFGSIIKNEFKSIPDRITDELISLSNDRDAFYALFSQSIEDALLKLSDTTDIQI